MLLILTSHVEIIPAMLSSRVCEKFHQMGPLHKAIEHGNLDLLVKLIAIGGGINDQTYWGGYSLLHVAIFNHQIKILHYLLTAHGIDKQIQDLFGRTPVDYAHYCNNDEALEALKLH